MGIEYSISENLIFVCNFEKDERGSVQLCDGHIIDRHIIIVVKKTVWAKENYKEKKRG